MDLNHSSMHLLPTDDLATEFTTPDNPAEESMLFLFPNVPSEDINAPMPSDVLPPSFSDHSTQQIKREPVFAPQELSIPMYPVEFQLDTQKRKHEDILASPSECLLPAPGAIPFSITTTPPTKRARTEPPLLGSPATPESPKVPAESSSSEEKPSSRSKPRSPRRKSRRGSPSSSDSEAAPRKIRNLEQMQSLARQHAPDVSLTNDELMKISALHESEEDLASSAAIYRQLEHFKQVLAHHGYKMTSVTLDPITEDAAAKANDTVDLVLKRRVRPTAFGPSPTAAVAPTPVGGSPSVSSPAYSSSAPQSPKKRCKPDGGEGVTCTICCKTMSDMDTLVRHFRHTHQELKPYCCPRCKGPYSSEGTLWHHIRNVHSEKARKFRCSQCDASYDSFGAKTRHEHAVHNIDKPQFVCTFDGCGRAFNFPAHLESHAAQDHPNFRPFGCTECKKRFTSANGLIRHKREVHRRNRAYSCSCGTTFAKKDHLKRHLLQRHSMSYEAATAEMKKQPSPGLVHFMPPAAPAAAEAV